MNTLHPALMPDEWYHGSSTSEPFEHFDHDLSKPDQEYSGNKHWNSHMGSHWTSEHSTAGDIAADHYGNVYHATLDMKKPRHYDSEYDMGDEAMAHLRAKHPGDEHLHSGSNSEYVLTEHPQAKEMAHQFRNHLQSQGYDGITYGNMYEGGTGHTCAIAFHPDQIHVSEHHGAYKECGKAPYHCEDCGRETDGNLQCGNCGHFTRPSSKTASEDYRMQHTAPGPGYGAPLHDLTGVYPADVYTHPHYYYYEPSDHRSMEIAHRVEGKPEAKVRIYRALPPEHDHEGIHPGDWVSIDRSYARQHGKHPTDPKQDWPVISASVPAKHVYTAGDSISEWGYHGPETVGATGKPRYTGPTKDFSFSGGGTGPVGSGQTRVNALGPQGEYAGHVLAQDGKVVEHHVEPQHADTDLGDRLLKAHHTGPPEQTWGDIDLGRTASRTGRPNDDLLPNPYHWGAKPDDPTEYADPHHHTWFHGGEAGLTRLDSPAHYTQDDFPSEGGNYSGPQTNKVLGTHFSALRKVAKTFAPAYRDSALYEGRLHMKKPAYFTDEHHLDREIFRHVVSNHPDFSTNEKFNDAQRWEQRSTPRHAAERDRQMGDNETDVYRRHGLDDTMATLIRQHPQQEEYAKSFVDHLKSKGHDGIVYGNVVEGPKFHHSAIVFDPDSIELTKIHHLPQNVPRTDAEPGKEHYQRMNHPDRTADDANDESDERIGEIQKQHTGSTERFDYNNASSTNLDNGPWKPYRSMSAPVRYAKQAGARKPVRRDPATGIELCNKKVEGLPCRFLLGHTQGCAIDWNAVYPDEPLDTEPSTKESRSHAVEGSKGQGRPQGRARGPQEGEDAGLPVAQPGSARQGPQRLIFHPQVAKDRKRLDPQVNRRVESTLDALENGTAGPQTHVLSGPLKGWNATQVSGQSGQVRVTHQPGPEPGTLLIGHIGPHNYDDAIRRLTSLGDLSQEQEDALRAHLMEHHPEVNPYSGNLDWQHRARHHLAGEKAMGPGRAEPLGSHDHHPSIDPYRASWAREAGANGPDYKGLTYDDPAGGYSMKVREEPKTQWGYPALHLTVSHEGRTVGGLSVFQRLHDGAQEPVAHPNVWVKEEHQRKGLASAMYSEVNRRWPGVPIQHSEHASDPPSVIDLDVHPDHRRQGIASRLFDLARQQDSTLVHSDSLTRDGRAFRDAYDRHHTAAVRIVSDDDSTGDVAGGIMIAIVPPEDMAHTLAVEEGDAPEQIHLTLAYLGKTDEYDQAHLDDLRENVAAWAEAHEPLTATVQGAGTFVKAQEDGQHVLWASVDAPGLERLHVSLVDFLEARGYHPSRSHVFVPHMTLAYGKHHFRFMPKIERETWQVEEIWICIAGRWESVPLGA